MDNIEIQKAAISDGEAEPGARERAEWCLKWLEYYRLQPGGTLFIGCHHGHEMDLFAKHGASQLAGIDIVPEFVDHCIRRGLTARLCDAMDADLAPYKNVYASHSVEHVTNRKELMQRLMAVKGWVFLEVPMEPEGTTNKAHLSPVSSLLEFVSELEGKRILRLEHDASRETAVSIIRCLCR